MPLLVRALIRYWDTAEFALAYARVKLREAEATGCPMRIAEWRRAKNWLQWLAGDEFYDWQTPTLKEWMEAWDTMTAKR